LQPIDLATSHSPLQVGWLIGCTGSAWCIDERDSFVREDRMMNRFVVFTVVTAAVSALPLGGAIAQQPPPSQPPVQQSPAGTAAGQMPGQQTGIAIASDSLLGTAVKDQQGKDIGKVSKLMIDPTEGRVTSVIISSGGTLGMGGKELSLPWNALQLQRDQDQRLVVTMQREMLQQAPQAEQGGQPAASPRSGDRKP
jgi:sporulation protein YlmC with PRC-barrel domain